MPDAHRSQSHQPSLWCVALLTARSAGRSETALISAVPHGRERSREVVGIATLCFSVSSQGRGAAVVTLSLFGDSIRKVHQCYVRMYFIIIEFMCI